MVAVPQHFEQLRNARAAQDAAIVLDGRASGTDVTPTELRAALQKVMADPRYREASARVGTSLRAGGGSVAAADVIETVARDRSGRIHPAPLIRTATDRA
jgi:UDP:flavonoid glycosyltransferase YjiC (YdhE family)